MSERLVKALLRFGLDETTLQQTVDGVLSVDEALERVEKQAQQTERRMQTLRDVADVGEQIADGMLVAAAAIGGPLLMALNSYVNQSGRAEGASAAWLDAMDRLNQSQMRIGRVVAEQALPVLEKAAGIAEDVAAFLEQNPQAVKVALSAAATLAAVGTVGKSVAMIAKFTADVGGVFAQLKTLSVGTAIAQGATGAGAAGATGAAAAGAAGTGTLATVGTVGALYLGGIGLGGLAFEGLAKTELGQSLGMREGTTGRALSVGAYALGSIFGEEAGEKAFQAVAKFTGVLPETAEAAENATEALEARNTEQRVITEAELDAFAQYNEKKAQAERDYEARRSELVELYGERRAEAEQRYEERRAQLVENYGEQRAQRAADFARNELRLSERFNDGRLQATQNFARQQAQAEAAYYSQRAQREAEYGIETARMEEDHQRNIERLRRDYNDRVFNAEIDRDAIGLFQAERDYEQQRQEAEENYSIQAQRRNEDFAREAAQLEANFKAQQAQRAADFARQQEEQLAQFEAERAQRQQDFALRKEELDADHEQRLAKLDEQYAQEQEKLDTANQDELNSLDTQYNNENQKRDHAFNSQLNDLGVFLGTEQETRSQYYAAMRGDYEAWLKAMRDSTKGILAGGSGGTSGGRQGGGYAPTGHYDLGEGGQREFVLNAATTRQMESAVGGPLNQSNVLYGMGDMNFSIPIDGAGMSPGAIASAVSQLVEMKILQVFEDAGRNT